MGVVWKRVWEVDVNSYQFESSVSSLGYVVAVWFAYVD